MPAPEDINTGVDEIEGVLIGTRGDRGGQAIGSGTELLQSRKPLTLLFAVAALEFVDLAR